jgi:pimeloyl-ACP methyl ester carboxylesterase
MSAVHLNGIDLHYAIHEPPLVSIVADDAETQSLIAAAAATMRSVAERVDRGDIEGGTRQFIEEIALGPAAWETLPRPLRETQMRNAPAFADDTRDPAWGEIVPSDLASLAVPMLLTQGDQSPAWFSGVVAALGRAIGAELRTFAGAGHAPHLTHPDDYVMTVADFARRAAGAIALR